MKQFKANGKLLISGEYVVLDGGLALALPTKLGQTLQVSYDSETTDFPSIFWKAILADDSVWFMAQIDLKSCQLILTSDLKLGNKLAELFAVIHTLNPEFFSKQNTNIYAETKLEFPKDWGLGSSSTLIYLLARFAEIDAFTLSDLTFKSSGYDVACAGNISPILYQIISDEKQVKPLNFNPNFADQLYFIHLNQKQDTQQSVPQQYKNLPKSPELIRQISKLTQEITQVNSLSEFEYLINQHETLLSDFMNLPKVKDVYFSDYEGSVKSLGAWGGDFVLVTARNGFERYFRDRGFTTIISYAEMIL